MGVGVCACVCHNVYRANQRGAQQVGEFMTAFTFAQRANQWDRFGCVDDDTEVDAAVACPVCIDTHCPALSSIPKREPRIVRRFDPNSESQSQADGNTDSEGKE